ncbi:hypothetical protein EUGRSUZ_L03552 [Eucalyptus grandis]|uniref:Uncharacterized protein n=1 Tax=Eucalyptus grandis TaxID=71139 RepID=A0AAD9T880_EUCGR|nr:hypothetical protein EUGRSUZ_L03552 [Eucalyptus grandis]
MGGNNGQKKSSSSSSFCFMNLFKPQRPRRDDARVMDSMKPIKIWPSDYNKGRYIADHDIDKKASDYIAKFHETQVIAD